MWLEQDLNIDQLLTSKEKDLLFSMGKVASLFSKLSDRFLSSYGLTEAQYRILELIHMNARSGLTQVDISEKLLVNRSNITGLIDRLEKSGFVQRSQDPGDRRINRIRLRDKAKKVIKSIQEPYIQFVAGIMSDLNKEEMKAMGFLLEKVEKQIEKRASSVAQNSRN